MLFSVTLLNSAIDFPSNGKRRYVLDRNMVNIFTYIYMDRLCGLVVRVSGYRYGGLGFDSRRYQIF